MPSQIILLLRTGNNNKQSQCTKKEFREGQWKEESLLRHMEPGLAYKLELERLSNYGIQYISTGGTFRQHLYFATRKDESGKLTEKRIFVRCLLNGEAPTEEVRSFIYVFFF